MPTKKMTGRAREIDAAFTRLAPVIRACSRRVQIHHGDVGVHEIVSLEEERLSRRDREGVPARLSVEAAMLRWARIVSTATHNTADWKQSVACQELGRRFYGTCHIR